MGFMESDNPKFASSHSKIEITSTHTIFFSLPEVSTESVSLSPIIKSDATYKIPQPGDHYPLQVLGKLHLCSWQFSACTH